MSYDSTACENFDDDVTALLDYEHAVTDVLALVGRRVRRTGPTYQRGHDGRGVLVARLVFDAGCWAVRIIDEHPSATVVAAMLPLDMSVAGEWLDTVLVDADHVLVTAGYYRTTVWDAQGGPLALVEALPDLTPPPWARRVDVLPLNDDGGAIVTFEREIGAHAGVGLYVDAETVVSADGLAASEPRVVVAVERDVMSATDARDLASRLTRAADVAEGLA